MPRKSIPVVAVTVLCMSAFAGEPFVGYYESPADFGGARNRLCVVQSPAGGVAVTVATAYCPGPDKLCANVRSDERSSQSHVKHGKVVLSEQDGCRITIEFNVRSATVSHNVACMNDEHPYFQASGKYARVRMEVNEDDCGL